MTLDPPQIWLLLVNAAATFFMVGVIWFVQVVRRRRPMSITTLALPSAAMLFSSLSARADQDPLSAHRWKHRLLVVHVPDTQAGRAALQSFRTSLDDRREDVLARDLLIVPAGDLPRRRNTLQPAFDLVVSERTNVRRRLGLHGRGAQLVLIGKDGGMKARQSEGVPSPSRSTARQSVRSPARSFVCPHTFHTPSMRLSRLECS